MTKILFFLASMVLSIGAFAHDADVQCEMCGSWNKPVKPFRIYGNTWYVGVKGLTSILITGQHGHILIDGALPQSAQRIEKNIRSLGFRLSDVKYILNSHAHSDHAGGIARLKKNSGATVVVSQANSDALNRGTNIESDPQFEAKPIVYFPKVADVQLINDGDQIVVGELKVLAHLTPGHTPGSTTWTWSSCEGNICKNIVLADSLNPYASGNFRFTGKSGRNDITKQFEDSIKKVESLPCDILLTVHPDIVDLIEKGEKKNTSAFIDTNACRDYAEYARSKLQERINFEKGHMQ